MNTESDTYTSYINLRNFGGYLTGFLFFATLVCILGETLLPWGEDFPHGYIIGCLIMLMICAGLFWSHRASMLPAFEKGDRSGAYRMEGIAPLANRRFRGKTHYYAIITFRSNSVWEVQFLAGDTREGARWYKILYTDCQGLSERGGEQIGLVCYEGGRVVFKPMVRQWTQREYNLSG